MAPVKGMLPLVVGKPTVERNPAGPNELPRIPAKQPHHPMRKKAHLRYKGHLTAQRGKMPAEVVLHAIAQRQKKG